MINNTKNLLVDNLLNKINLEYPMQQIITKQLLDKVLENVDLTDKKKIKNIYIKLIDKIKNSVSVKENNKKLEDILNNSIYNDKENLSIKKDIDIKPKINNDDKISNVNLIIDNSQIDTDEFKNIFDFCIYFDKEEDKKGYIKEKLNMVKSITLKNIIIKDVFTDIPYLILEIDELGKDYISNNNIFKNAFCILYEYDLLNGYRYYKIEKKTTFDVPKTFNKLSIKLKDHLGNQLNNENKDTLINFNFKLEKISINFFSNYSEFQIKD